MVLRFAARARRGHFGSPVTLMQFALMLGVCAPEIRADPSDLPERVKGTGVGEMSVTNDDGVVNSVFSVSIVDVADLISRLPDGTVEAGDFKVDPSANGDAARLVLPSPEAPQRFDVWAEGRHTQNADEAGLVPPDKLLVGADYQLSPLLTVGALAGLNQLETNADDADVWSGGPYARFEPIPNLFLTGLATWHGPETIPGKAKFDGLPEPNRFRLTNQLSGDLSYGAWRLTPSIGYELDDAAQDAAGLPAGTLSFGPTIGYRHERSDGTVIEPHLAVKGTWDLAPFIGLKSDAFTPSPDGLDATLEGAIRLQDFTGWSLDASTSVGGVDDPNGTIDWQSRVGVKVPLN